MRVSGAFHGGGLKCVVVRRGAAGPSPLRAGGGVRVCVCSSCGDRGAPRGVQGSPLCRARIDRNAAMRLLMYQHTRRTLAWSVAGRVPLAFLPEHARRASAAVPPPPSLVPPIRERSDFPAEPIFGRGGCRADLRAARRARAGAGHAPHMTTTRPSGRNQPAAEYGRKQKEANVALPPLGDGLDVQLLYSFA